MPYWQQKTAKGSERYLIFGPNHILITFRWDDGRSTDHECLSVVLKQIQLIIGSIKTIKSCVSWKMLEMEFTFSKLVKMRVSTAYASRNRQGKPAFIKENEKTEKQKSKSVKFLRYTDEFFFPTNDCTLLESCQLYILAKYKASNCC